jgi:cell division protein FtsQ
MAIAVAAVVVSCVLLYNSSLFPVKSVEVTGNERLTEAHVRDLAAVPSDATLLRFPADEVGERVKADPWVASVSVSRDFPDTMQIRVVEREPAALVDLVEEYLVVDADGHMIERRSLEETTALVVIRDVEGIDPTPGRRSTSEGLRNALDILTRLSEEMRSQTRAISVPTIDETALLTNEGVEIFFGIAEDVEKKDLVAREILAEQAGAVVFIDVRAVDRPIWRGLEQQQ